MVWGREGDGCLTWFDSGSNFDPALYKNGWAFVCLGQRLGEWAWMGIWIGFGLVLGLIKGPVWFILSQGPFLQFAESWGLVL